MNRRNFFRRIAGIVAGAALTPARAYCIEPQDEWQTDHGDDAAVFGVLQEHARRLGEAARIKYERFALDTFTNGRMT